MQNNTSESINSANKYSVLYLTNIPAPYTVDFFNELGKHCNLTVLYERRSASDRSMEWMSSKDENYRAIYLKGVKFGFDSAACPGVIRYLSRKHDFIIVGNYASPTGIVSILFMNFVKKHFIISFDGALLKDESKAKGKLKAFLLTKAGALLSTNRETDQYLTHYGVPLSRIHRYPISSLYEKDIDTSVLSQDEKKIVRRKLGIHEDKVVIMIGQFIYRKGIDILLKASTLINNSIGYYCVGGVPTKEMEALAKDKPNIHFIGFLSKQDLAAYYHAADVFAFPTREDIWGFVVHEAMARGLPVITTNKCNCGLTLITDGVNGRIIDANNVCALAQAIKEFFDGGLSTNCSQAALTASRDYTLEKMACRHLEILNELHFTNSKVAQ